MTTELQVTIEDAQQAVLDRVAEVLPEEVYQTVVRDAQLGPDIVKRMDSRKKYHWMLNQWRNNGWDYADQRYEFDHVDWDSERTSFQTMVDAVSVGDASLLLPRVISTVVREAQEPVIALTPLMREIRYSAGTQLTFPATGAFTAEDIAEGQEYPERALEFAGQVIANIGKVGVAVRFTEEMLRYSQFDVMGLHLRAAGRALIRHKELKVAALLVDNGTVSFDNSGATSTHGKTTGRGIDMAGNSTIRLDDIFLMYADTVNDGFIPDTLGMHPAGWLVFARDGTARAFGFANGGALFQPLQGSPGRASSLEFPSGGVNLGQNPKSLDLATTRVDVPTLFPAPLSLVVSPFFTYDSTENTTDIVMWDRAEGGVIVVDEDVVTDKFDDVMRDMQKIKLRERYGVALNNNGEAVRVAKSVKTNTKNWEWEDTFAATGTIPSDGLPAIT